MSAGCRLICGDCLEVMGSLADGGADMLLADLPYGVTKNPWDCRIDLAAFWEQARRAVKPDGAMVLFASGMFTSDLMASNRKDWRYNLIWRKPSPTGFLNANRMPLRAHEDICVFYRRAPVYHPQKTAGPRKVATARHRRNCRKGESYGDYTPVTYDSAERYPTSVLDFATDKQRPDGRIHPAQKPVALCEWLIRTYTDAGETVLDCCMGSGTSGIAARRCGRRFIGIERDRGIFGRAIDRFEVEQAGDLQ